VTPLLVIPDTADPAGGARWQPLVDAWDGPGLALDLPGHGVVPPPLGASYAPGDAALIADRALRLPDRLGARPVVVGHGWGAFAAELLASGGRASSLVLIDGLGGPWASNDELVAEQHRWLHAVFADAAALAAPPSDGIDPRLAHGHPTVWQRAFTEARRATITVPVLALESPASRTPSSERDERVAAFGGPARWLPIEAVDPAAVAASRPW
jgi:pimeloyl-ACP methyl ester carboxylesterase